MQYRTGTLRAAAWALVIAFAATASIAVPAQAANNHGAIAFSQRTGAHGYSFDFPTKRAAQNRALQECAKYGGGCKIATWFMNNCGALAVGNGNGWGADWAPTRRQAENLALQRCNSVAGNCWIRRWVCTTR